MAHIVGTNGNDSLVGTSGVDTIEGLGGNDTLVGLGGSDSLIGGLGNDRYVVGTGDVLSDAGGIDTIETSITWHLAAGFENLVATGTATTSHGGNNLDNHITGSAGSNWIAGREGNDTLLGGGGNDTFNMSNGAGSNYGTDSIDGGTGVDTLDYGAAARTGVTVDLQAGTASGGGLDGGGSATLVNIENVNGTAFDDQITGNSAANFLFGFDGWDRLDGRTGNDRLEGGAGGDWYMFTTAPSTANADTVVGFASGSDKIVLDGSVHANSGGNGQLAAGDSRFAAGAGFNSGQDASDRVIYNTTTGQLWYDADGNGAGAAQLIATLQGAPTFAATDIIIQGASSGSVINGTEGDDTLNGTGSNDTINGFGGNDSLFGSEGADVLNGGTGNDTLDGWFSGFSGSEPDVDTLNGGQGDDVFMVDNDADVLIDAGGVDTVIAKDRDWTLDSGFENLVLNTDGFEGGGLIGVGNELANHMRVTWAGDLEGGGGNDTLVGGRAMFATDHLSGGDGDDLIVGLLFDQLFGGAGSDTMSGEQATMTGGGGADHFTLNSGVMVADFTPAQADKVRLDGDLPMFQNVGFSGNFALDDERFHSGAGVTTAHDSTDRLIYNSETGELYYDRDGAGGADSFYVAQLVGAPTLQAHDIEVVNGSEGSAINGTSGDDSLAGTAGDDTINGLGGNDTLYGDDGADELNGGDGNDVLRSWIGGQNQGDFLVDTLSGGLGDDQYEVSGEDSIAPDPGGIDTVYIKNGDWTLGAGLDNLHSVDTVGSGFMLTGNELDNLISDAGSEGGVIFGMGGNDTIALGNAFNSSYAEGGDGNDTMYAARDTELHGDAGNDLLVSSANGGTSTTMVGGSGADIFLFRVADGHRVTDFDRSSGDRVQLDATNMPALGASGAFTAGDARFHAAAGATGGHDADDRVIYNTSTNQLFYDADGNGSQGAAIIATLQPGATVIATDIAVVNGTAPAGTTINGTTGNDNLVGTAGNDTINALAGEDRADGGAGDDSLTGSAGHDTLLGGTGNDTLVGGTWSDLLTGGAGADSFVYAEAGTPQVDQVTDFVSGTDEVMLENAYFTALGGNASWTGGDARFWAAAGAVSGHDADDRLVYNTSTGNLYYDADGSGAGAALVIATFTGAPGVVASDITVI